MAVTIASFRARYTEFAQDPADAVVTAVLADAVRECDERLFGDDTDSAVMLMAAHKLAGVQPMGMNARLEPKGGDGTTTYLAEWRRLARKRAGGPWVTGQGPTGDL